ncbi:MAG: hypothetical protein ABL958_03830 [Bdellovibrionia bacterium]
MNRTFEKIILTIALLVVLFSGTGLFISFTAPDKSLSNSNREVVGNLATVDNSVKRKGFGTFAWDVMESGEPVFFKDVIFVSPKSSMLLRLNDQTELVVGENTLLVLDNKMFGEAGRMDVTELRLIRGNISVRQAEGGGGEGQRGLQIVLNDKVKLDLANASGSFSKNDDKASILLNKGDMNLSMSDKSRKLASDKPMLINELDLANGGVDGVKTEDAAAGHRLAGLGNGSGVSSQGELSASFPQRTFASRNKSKVSELVGDEAFITDRTVAAIATPAPTPQPTPVALLPEKLEPTPEPRKARLAINPLAPDDNATVDLTRDIRTLTFEWDSSVNNVHFYMLEISPDKRFASVLTRIAVDSAEGRLVRDEHGKAMKFQLKVSPIYMLYVPGLLGSVYKNREIYWRVVPLDRDNNPLLKTKVLATRKIGFKVSKTAEIITNETNIYTKENVFTSEPSVKVQWTFKNVVPGSYQLVIASDPEFKTQICTKDISKYSFKKGVSLKQQTEISGQVPKVDLTFSESISVNVRTECPLEALMKAEKPFYYKVISYDPADQKVPYTDIEGASGTFNFK